jgi:rhamnose transport system permease protein
MTADSTPAATAAVGLGGRVAGALGRSRELTLVLLMVVMVAFVTINAPHFLSPSNLIQVTSLAAIIAIAAVGQALVVMTKNIDLSVESVIGFTAFLVGDLLRSGVPVPGAWLVGIGAALALGMLNGALVTAFRIPSIVVTLGTLSIYRGLVFVIAGGTQVNLVDLPPGYSDPASQSVAGLPVFVWVAVAITGLVAVLLYKTRFGRQVYAVGSNAEAAAVLGIRSRTVVFTVLALCGLLAGVAGIMWGMYFGTIYATSGSGVVLQIVAAVVVGGVTIAGGSGTVVGAALGALFLGLINNSLLLLQMPQELLLAIYGLVILVAVIADSLLAQRQRRRVAMEARR